MMLGLHARGNSSSLIGIQANIEWLVDKTGTVCKALSQKNICCSTRRYVRQMQVGLDRNPIS